VPEFLNAIFSTKYFDKAYFVTDTELVYGGPFTRYRVPCNFIALRKDFGWSNNIIEALDYVEEDVFFMGCEDHLLVDFDESLVDWAYKVVRDGWYGCVRLTRKAKIPIAKEEWQLCEIDKSYKYYISLQPSVWSKEYLKKIIEPNLTSWQFEIIGSQNAKKIDPTAGVTYKTAFNYRNLIEKGKLVENPKTYTEIHG
jgi:hypothetical protein